MGLAQHIEHTLLRAEATPAAIERLCQEALEHGFVGVCVNPAHVPRAVARVGGRVRVVSVVGFPLGAGSAASDVAEVSWLVEQGCAEVDWVVPIGLALAAEWQQVTDRTAAIRRAAGTTPIKVILETGHFEPERLQQLCTAVLQAGPDFLKTSTGFGPRGASVEDVHRMATVAGKRAQIKASGGIRELGFARELLHAGATRLGTSSGVDLVRAEANSTSPGAQ